MAESKSKKGKKSVDDFVDDLDAVLGEAEASPQQVGMLDDDEAIDRLLMGDLFEQQNKPQFDGGDDDIDRLLEQNGVYERKAAPAADGFSDDIDDIIAGFDLNPKQQAAVMPEVLDDIQADPIADDQVAAAWPDSDEFDEFADDDRIPLEAVDLDSARLAVPENDNEKMTEIDEFTELPSEPLPNQDDFLMADFNISVDDDLDIRQPTIETTAASPAAEPMATTVDELIDDAMPDNQETVVDDFADDDIEFVLTPSVPDDASVQSQPLVEPALSATEITMDAVEEPAISAAVDVAPAVAQAPIQSPVDHSAELAALTGQIGELKKLLKQARHEVDAKVDREEMTACLDSIDSLQTEQKKNKRNLEALLSKKPIGVYVANGVAAVAVIVAAGLWIDSFITKSQLTQLVEIVGQLKQQVEAMPTADAADKEMMRKQLDELAVQQTVINNQLAEFGKTLHGDGQKAGGDIGKQISELTNQDMQMGSAIEALQHKVAVLEKGKTAAVPSKPVAKKVVVEENWAVNLIAFKQDWYAKRKADEFAGKGVAAKVSRTDNKGEVWYRLSVDGFPSQAEATAYAAKVKKTLNLDSVWVAKNKE